MLISIVLIQLPVCEHAGSVGLSINLHPGPSSSHDGSIPLCHDIIPFQFHPLSSSMLCPAGLCYLPDKNWSSLWMDFFSFRHLQGCKAAHSRSRRQGNGLWRPKHPHSCLQVWGLFKGSRWWSTTFFSKTFLFQKPKGLSQDHLGFRAGCCLIHKLSFQHWL